MMEQNSAEYEALKRDIASIDEAITSISPPARLDEETFKTIFLPMFYGAEKEKLHSHAQMGAWIACAGGVYNEVEIFDANGETLFNVPPARLQLPVDYQRDRRSRSLLAEIQMANLHGARHPRQGEAYLKQVLDTYVVNTKELEDVIGYLKRWNDIFTRYGYPGFIIPGTKTNSNQTAADGRNSDDEEEILL